MNSLSVRTILNTVFLTLAIGLCAALSVDIWRSWQAVGEARRTAVLAEADRDVFHSMTTVRSRRADLQTAIQALDQPAQRINELRAEVKALTDKALAGGERTGVAGVGALATSVRQRVAESERGWPAVEAVAAKPKAERDLKETNGWYDAIGIVAEDLGKLSLALSGEVRMNGPQQAELMAVRQAAWTIRDQAGLECGIARPVVATSGPMPAPMRTRIDGLRGGAQAGWTAVNDILARPGASSALAGAAKTARDIHNTSLTYRNSVYSKFDNSGKPAVPPAEWTGECTKPFVSIMAIAALASEHLLTYAAEAEAQAWRGVMTSTIGLLVAIAVSVLGLLLVRRRVATPVRGLTEAVGRVAARDYTTPVPATGYKDEFGSMAEALESLRQGALAAEKLSADSAAARESELKRAEAVNGYCREFDTSIRQTLETVNSATRTMTQTANGMTEAADRTSKQSTVVAAASEEASTNVQTVAAAAEELAASVQEISRQVNQAATIAGDAATRAKTTNVSIQGLAAAAQKIGDVVKLINDIAGQTNLLALNATIEAARAGEAGKGFAVVASEVKSLATQTAKATEDIAAQVNAIQASTREAVSATEAIGAVITQVNEINSAIAAAVEEQGAATQEIARNAQQASRGTTEVSSNITGVTQIAGETGTAAAQVLDGVKGVVAQSDTLRNQVDSFLAKIRAA